MKEAKTYEVSNLGKVRNMHTKHVLRPRTQNNGYKALILSKKYKLVHRVVAKAFHPNPLNLPCVNHLDTDKGNNKASNLEWCTHAQNSNHPPTLKLLRSNMKKRYKNASGVRRTKYDTFFTNIRVGRKLRPHLGTFKTEEEARVVFLQARAIRNALDEILPNEGVVKIIQFANLSKSK